MGKLTATQIIDRIVDGNGVSKSDAKAIIDAFFEQTAQELQAGHEVGVYGFGTFKPKHNAARQGRNPGTGEPLQIAASTTVSFKPAKAMKDRMNA